MKYEKPALHWFDPGSGYAICWSGGFASGSGCNYGGDKVFYCADGTINNAFCTTGISTTSGCATGTAPGHTPDKCDTGTFP